MAGNVAWNRKTREEVVEDILEQYPHYDCSKVVYTGRETPVEIVCPEHSSFYKCYGKRYECQAYKIKDNYGKNP